MFGSKSATFGFGDTSSFGSSTPFGQKGFGTPAFGTQSTSTGSLFGSPATTTSGGLFGTQPTFGQPSSAFSFNSTPSTSGGLFGQQQQQQTQGNSLFSQPTSNAFAKTTMSSFGSFGTNTASSNLFVRNQPAGNIFGQTNTMFGGGGSTGTGTNTKFLPPVSQDTMVKGGSTNNISTRHQCISAMKEYEDKSLEELRLEDYVAGRKGKQQQQLVQPQQQQPAQSTSLFGTPTSQATAGFGFGQNKSTGFGNTTGFGNARTNTSIFGQPRCPLTSSGLFGQPSKPLFANQQDSSSFTFGTNTNTGSLFGANQPQQNKGLFGNTTSQSNLFGTTNTATFGASTTGFGTNSTTPGLFGNKTMNFNTPSTNSFSFGQNTGNSLFTKPATSTSFPFGANTTTPGFGQNTATGLFNKTFNTNSGLGNNQSSFNFSSTNTPNLFGNQKSFSPFNLNVNPNPSGFGTGLGTGTSNMFNLGGNTSTLGSNTMSLSGATSDQANLQQHLKLLTHNPYGDSSLFMNLNDSKVKTEDILKPTNPTAQKAVLQYKVSARPMAKVKPKSLLPLISGKKTQMFDGLDDEDDFGFNSDDFTPKKNIKKLVIKNSGSASKAVFKIQDKSVINNSSDSTILQSPSLSETAVLPRGKDDESPFVELFNKCVTPEKNLELSSITLESCPDEAQDSLSKPDGESEVTPAPPPHPANIVLSRPGYYTLPSLEELADLVDENGNCFIKDFTIGREGYGSVFFPGTTNIAGMNFDEIVHFRKKEVTVYPDDSVKPEVGLGLNKKAEITLDCVWPIDKTSRSPIKSSERLKMMKYEEKLENTTLRIGGTFLDYRPETGSWVFEVKHFSKYGLKDDSDDEEIITDENKLKSLQQQNLSVQKQKIPSTNQTGPPSKDLAQELGSDPNQVEMTNGEDNLKPAAETTRTRDELPAEDDAEMPDIFSADYSVDEALNTPEIDKPSELFSHSLAVGLGVSSSNMQMMKASFFSAETDELMEKELDERMQTSHTDGHMLKLLNRSAPMSSLPISGKSVKHCRLTTDAAHGKPKSTLPRPQSDVIQILRVQPANTYPKVVGMRIKRPIPIIKESCMYKMRSLVDASFFMGHSFRVGWGPNWTFVHSGMSVGNAIDPAQEKFSILAGREKKVSVNTDWKVNLEKLNVSDFLTSKNPAVINQHKWMLENQLDHSSCVTENECPYFSPIAGTESLNIYAAMAEQDEENMSSLPDYEQVHHMRTCWDICVALWGNPIELHSQANDKTSYEYHQMRREAISRWISETEANAINAEIEKNSFQTNGHLKNIMSYLSGRQIPEACANAQKAGDNYLAMLLAQAGGVNKSCKQLIEQQLENFNTYGVGEFVSPERLKILSLLAGKMVLNIGNQTINVCEDMNWRRALGLHLWYNCEPTSLIVEAVQRYDAAQIGNNFLNKYANPPVPAYLEDDDNDLDEPAKIYDTCYHLLKLYANDAHSLEQTLSPTTSTVNHLDYRLSWHLSQVLESLGYKHLSLYQKECIHTSFASQLESLGIWEWAIFILAHIEDPRRREAAIKDCLGRHIRVSNNEYYLSCEQFIINRLGIPSKWVHHAKAVKAGYLVIPQEEAWHLLKSHNWNKAHKVILKHLAADAIINENHNYLEKYLIELAPAERNSKILDWSTGGAVYLNYINLCKALQEMKKQEATISQLEKLWPEVTSLCSKINHLPSCNPKDRLCQSEMSKNAANILRTLLMLKAQNDVHTEITSILAPHICNLEMPDDYMVQEFQALIQCYRQEMCNEICL